MVEYTLIRSKTRRRSLSLHVTNQGEVVVRAPMYTPKLFIDHFVHTKRDWIAKRQTSLASQPAQLPHFSESELKTYILAQVARYADILALQPTEVKFTKVKSYWGNCSPAGVLRFNTQLRFATPTAVAYVVVHELAHLRYKGHGKRFWGLVGKTYPEFKLARKTLRSLRLSH